MPAHHRFTLDEYLEFELGHAEKFEYADGAILAMAGASPRHNAIAVNTTSALHVGLLGRCRVLGSDQRIATPDGIHSYADGVVVCGPMDLTTYKGTATLHNPTMLVEVLSPSTRDYDLGENLARYKTIPSLQHVLLMEPDSPDVLHVRRTAAGWDEAHVLTGEVSCPACAFRSPSSTPTCPKPDHTYGRYGPHSWQVRSCL